MSKDSDKEYLDTEEYPEDRGRHILCLNCQRNWNSHTNWACDAQNKFGDKSFLSIDERYLTPDMVESPHQKEANTSTCSQENIEIDNWKAWAHKVEGECPCGIVREDCKYHK